ncbi:lauroyl-Kdo(2)-lipid IV(A) myristoyltransferase [Vibrio sp.]|nr:lauroyl-Kdo(2)-lipid IV(A) myristoyltransferase [Vibrio sp.]
MSQSPRNDFDPTAYNPTFQWHFLAPKYWGTWLAILLLIPVTLLPVSWRHWVAKKAAKKLIKKRKSTTHTAWVNLGLCFPDKSEAEREEILYQTLVTAGVFMSGFALLTLKNKAWLHQQCDIQGLAHLEAAQANNNNVILLVPHTWPIDIPAVLLASMGMPVVGFAKKQSNDVMDWLMHRQRVQYGGRIYERSAGIKPFIKSVREGYLGYYLPDQDHGPKLSLFVDFFATRKATLPGLGKMSKVCKASVLPLFSRFDAKSGRYVVEIHPPLAPFPAQNEEQDATLMNQFIESRVGEHHEQYMWILKLLKTQESGVNYYQLAQKDSDWLQQARNNNHRIQGNNHSIQNNNGTTQHKHSASNDSGDTQ